MPSSLNASQASTTVAVTDNCAVTEQKPMTTIAYVQVQRENLTRTVDCITVLNISARMRHGGCFWVKVDYVVCH
jgi:hypothetical protein